MNKIATVALALVVFAISGCANSGNSIDSPLLSSPVGEDGFAKDARIVSSLIGTWSPDPREKTRMDGSTTYRRDGTGTVLAWPLGHPEQQTRIDFVWSVFDTMLTERPVKTNAPPSLVLPQKLVDRVISISENEIVIEMTEGYDNTGLKGKRRVKIREN